MSSDTLFVNLLTETVRMSYHSSLIDFSPFQGICMGQDIHTYIHTYTQSHFIGVVIMDRYLPTPLAYGQLKKLSCFTFSLTAINLVKMFFVQKFYRNLL